MDELGQEFDNQEIKQTIHARGEDAINANILIARQAFLLERYDFDKIIKSEGFWYNIGIALFGSSIVLLINIIAKAVGGYLNKSIKVDEWELYALLITTVLMIIAFLLHKCIPNERRRIIKKIQNHFKEN